jgi:tetratricopeptide (TPR) repeat protein
MWVIAPLFLVLLASVLVVASWMLASQSTTSASADVVENYFASTMYRTSASTDLQIEHLQARLRSTPNDWQSYSLLGIAYLQKARETGDPSYYPKAEGVLNHALSFEPADYTALCAMGGLALARHDFAGALTWGQRARQSNADKTFAYGVIADAQIELGRYDEAVHTLQTMVDLRPDLSSYTRISYIRELHGDSTGALEMMQRAVDGGGSNLENKAWARTQLANLYFNLGNLDQAEIEYQRALELMPRYIYALAGLGRVRAAQGRTSEAIDLLNQATQTMPLPDFVITLGDVYARANNLDAARQQYDLVHVIQQLYQANGVDLDAEIALFNADHDLDPVQTLALARQAYARRPSIYAADVLAWALYKNGDYPEAQTMMEQALRLGTRNALMDYHAGMIAYRLGQRQRATDYLDKAIQLNPHFSLLYSESAQKLLGELRGQTSRMNDAN